jgi:hypothetical protein
MESDKHWELNTIAQEQASPQIAADASIRHWDSSSHLVLPTAESLTPTHAIATNNDDEHIMNGQDVTLDDGKESDYGSEFGTDDEATLSVLLTTAASQPSTSISDHASILPDTSSLSPFARGTRRKYVDDEGIVFDMVSRDGPVGEASIEIEYDEHNRISFSRMSSYHCWLIVGLTADNSASQLALTRLDYPYRHAKQMQSQNNQIHWTRDHQSNDFVHLQRSHSLSPTSYHLLGANFSTGTA